MDTIDERRQERAAPGSDGKDPRTIGFLLLQGFDFSAYWAAVEPLVVANIVAGREVYRWVQLSADGGAVAASDGFTQRVEAKADFPPPLDGLFVCSPAGVLPEPDCKERTFAPQQSESISASTRQTTGALARRSFDQTLELVDRQYGPSLSAAIDDWRLRLQSAEDPARAHANLFERFRVHEEVLLRSIALIVARAAERPSSDELATAVGVSAQKLQRLFAAHVGIGVQELIIELRLQRAQWLLLMTSMPIDKVASSCGFQRTVALNRAYRKRFGQSPHWMRGRA